MKIGTKSLLFGCHQFLVHPYYVLKAWVLIFGRPSVKELIGIVIHDWGYWGCSEMDGPEGERHPWFAGRLMSAVFGARWLKFCIGHSKTVCDLSGNPLSKLYVADKIGTALMPCWLWVRLARWTGDLDEYMGCQKHKDRVNCEDLRSPEEHFYKMRGYFFEKSLKFLKESSGTVLSLGQLFLGLRVYNVSFTHYLHVTESEVAVGRIGACLLLRDLRSGSCTSLSAVRSFASRKDAEKYVKSIKAAQALRSRLT